MDTSLVSVCVFEQDKDGEVLMVWAYPNWPDEEEREFMLSRCTLTYEGGPACRSKFLWSRQKNHWNYVLSRTDSSSAEVAASMGGRCCTGRSLSWGRKLASKSARSR